MEFTTDIFSLFDRKWALLTAGVRDDFNSMTVSWGSLGTLWGKSVATAYVRTSRYTHSFMDREDWFSLSFFPEELREKLVLLGTKSGREVDKMNDSGLTVLDHPYGIVYREAEITLVCRKLFMQPLEVSRIPREIQKTFYDVDSPHDMYIGEVTEILRR